MTRLSKNIIVISAFISFLISFSQGTLKEYKKAITVDSLFKNKVFNTPKEFHWLENDLLWYVNNSEKREN